MFFPQAYGDVLGPLVDVDRDRDLGVGSEDRELLETLRGLTIDTAFAGSHVEDRTMASACCGAVWLLHDYLDHAHHIFQSIEAPSGSLWHGIMHRREGDYSNAQYWFRRTGAHPVFDALHEQVRGWHEETPGTSLASLASAPNWDACRFVDLCRDAVLHHPNEEPVCRRIQQLEWELLFDYCYRYAVTKDVPA